jgi:hypothetical protein
MRQAVVYLCVAGVGYALYRVVSRLMPLIIDIRIADAGLSVVLFRRLRVWTMRFGDIARVELVPRRGFVRDLLDPPNGRFLLPNRRQPGVYVWRRGRENPMIYFTPADAQAFIDSVQHRMKAPVFK